MIDGASERGRPRKWPPPRPRSPEPGLNVKTSTGNGAPGLCPGGPRPAVPLAGRHRRPGLCRAGRRGPADVGPLRQAALPGRQSLPERHFPTGLHVGGGHGRLPGGGRVRQGRKGAVHLGHLHARRQARGQGRRGQRQLPQRGGRRARPAPAGRGPLPLLAVVAADLPRRHPRQPQPGGRALLPRAAGAAEGGRRGAGGHALPLGPARGAAAAAGRLEPPADGPALPRLRRLLLPGLRRARQVVDHHRQPLRRGPPRLRHRGAGAGHQGGPRPALPGGACAAAGSRGGVAHLRPRLPAAPRRPRVDGAGLALGAPQPHPPGEPARVPVLPGARAGLVRLAALRRRRLPGLHEGPPGRPPAGPRRRRAAAAAGGRRLLRPVSQRRAQLPAGQRQPQVRSAGGPGPAHAALLGQRRVRPARHLRGAERMVRVGQHQDPGPQAHVLLEEVHRRGPEIRGGGRREVAGLHGVVSDGRLRVAPRVRHPAGPLLRGLQHTRHEAGAQDLGRLLQVGAPGGGRRRRARSDNGETCWRLFPGRRNVIRRNGFPELPENRPARGVFPCDFAWGVSANSIQVESSPSQFADRNVYTWNVDNGELTRLEGPPAPPSAREAHCADYVSIGQQVDEIQAAGVNHFHFSLNWSALVPTGEAARPNATLLGYYRCFSRQLLRANVTPVVTLWHHTRHGSSLPAPVDGANRWLGGETPDLFADYARLCFRELGRHVKMWITLNEPNDETVSYQEAHQMLRAHALAWRAYDRDFRAAQGGQVSLALHMDWVEPAYSFSREDVEPAKRVLDFRVGWFAQPVFGDGDYPLGMRSWLRQLNSLELPAFKEEDRSLVRGTYDFFAISHFSTELVTHAKEDPYTYTSSLEVQHMIDTTWILSPRPVVPWGLRKALNWVKERYPHVPIYVMANGVQEDAGRFKDSLRVFYLYNYINEALKAFTLDGVNLKGYFAYALDDQRDPGFGLYGHVHHEAVAKASLANYRNIIRHDGFPAPGAPDRRRRCPAAAGPAAAAAPLCPGCGALAKRPVVGFLTLVCSAALVATGLVVYYASRPRKSAY
ncbi:uncharacterized protein kl isoform X1 [Stigmatopora argus]